MYLHEISIPVSSYEGDEVFHQLVHFVTNKWRSPTKQEICRSLQLLHDRDSVFCEYTGTWSEAMEIVALCDLVDFPITYDGLICTNSHVQHPKFGRQSIRVYTREIVDMRTENPVLKTDF